MQNENLQSWFNDYLNDRENFNELIQYKRTKLSEYRAKKPNPTVLKAMERDLATCETYQHTTNCLIENLLFEFQKGSTTTEKIISLEGRVGDFWKAFEAFGIPKNRVVDTLKGIRLDRRSYL